MGWGGVGWDVNVHLHFHTYVLLRHCLFFCNFHTDVMLRHCLFFCNFQTDVMLRHCLFFCNFHTYGVHQATVLIRLRASWRKKTLRGLSMEKLNPQVRRPLFLHQNWRFAMAKPWICANYSDGKNSAGMFMSMFLHVSSFSCPFSPSATRHERHPQDLPKKCPLPSLMGRLGRGSAQFSSILP